MAVGCRSPVLSSRVCDGMSSLSNSTGPLRTLSESASLGDLRFISWSVHGPARNSDKVSQTIPWNLLRYDSGHCGPCV